MGKERIESKNGSIEALLEQQIEAFNNFARDVNQRFEDMERKQDSSGAAKLLIANRMFDTDSEHLPEMSNNPLRTIRPLADAATAAAILDDDVQSGKKSLGCVWRDSYYRHMRGLRGNLLEKAKDLAMEEARSVEKEPYDESSLGKGL